MQWQETSVRFKLAIYLFYRKIINLNQALCLIVCGERFFYPITESNGINVVGTKRNFKELLISRLKIQMRLVV